MSVSVGPLDPFDEAVYDAARAVCAERAILGGSHAFDDRATFTTASRVRSDLERLRPELAISGALVTAALRRLVERGLVERVRLQRNYKTVAPRRVRHYGYVVVGEKP